MKHNWKKDKNGEADEWAWEFDFHNGVVCKDCGKEVCVHCHPDYMEMDDCCGSKTCATCFYWDNFNWVCCNGDSENRADFTNKDDTCEEWRMREAEPDAEE